MKLLFKTFEKYNINDWKLLIRIILYTILIFFLFTIYYANKYLINN